MRSSRQSTVKKVKADYPSQIFDHIRRIVRALRVTSRNAEKKLGLTAAQLFVLKQLREKSPLSLKTVAKATLTDPSTVSVVVQHLYQKGLITRKRSLKDRREIELALTPAGIATLKQSFRSFQEILSQAVHEMPAKRQRELARLLEEVCAKSGILEERLTMFFEDESAKPASRARKPG